MNLITDLKALDKAIASIATRGKKLDADIQHAGLSCLQHLDAHGDMGPLTRLLFALPKGARSNALLDWAQKFGKVTVNVGADHKTKPFLFDKEGKTDLAGATELPWYECKPEKPANLEFSLAAQLAQLIKKAEKAANDEGVALDANHVELMAKLKTLTAAA